MTALLSFFILALTVQQPAAPAFELAAVKVVGAKRYTSEDVTRLSGLVIGKPLTPAELKPAAERLADSGLFKTMQYSYTTAGRRMTVTFEFEEAEWTVPVLFDNFVWFSDAEIIAAVRRDVPSFDGTVPPSAYVPDLVTRSLTQLLASKGLPGTVTFVPQADMKGTLLQYLFKVADPAPKICALTVPGASAEVNTALLDAAKTLIGSDYSRLYVKGVSGGTLLDVYRRRGHWRAEFGPPSVAAGDASCSGVRLTIPVTEGPSYAWEKAEWSGAAALSPAELDAQLGMKPGDTADASKLEAGLRAVQKAYGKRGHLQAQVRMKPRLDDAARRAVFEMSVSEGPQFRMGTLEFVGLSEKDAESLRKKWTLAAGAPYDDTYAAEFRVKELVPLLRGVTPPVRVSVETSRQGQTVNVRLVFRRAE